MTRYANHSGHSGVIAFDIGSESIRIQFVDGSVYLYNYYLPGIADTERMKELAREGRGLSTYISTHVKDRYAAKLPR